MLNKTKIIATVGPSTRDPDIIARMIYEGTSGFRINFSHGNVKEWEEFIKLIEEAEEETEKNVAIIGDLQGPTIRIGILEKTLKLKPGDIIEIVASEKSVDETRKIPVPYQQFFNILEKGDRILIDDGEIVAEVIEKSPNKANAKVLVGGKVSSKKKISIKDKETPMPMLSEKDKRDLSFAVEKGLTYIMTSFTESRSMIELIRRYVEKMGGEGIPILAKIETKRGVENIDEIARASDGIVVARGDLGTHFPLEKIPVIQRRIVEKTRSLGKPVIIATQLLSSMTSNPVPTRSEIVDVYNAVEEGADALLLTNETAIGRFPVETVSWLKKIIVEAERNPLRTLTYPRGDDSAHRFARGIVGLSESIEAKILVFSKSGNTAIRISKYRPSRGIYAGVPRKCVARKLSIIWGVEVLVVPTEDYEQGLSVTEKRFKEKELVCTGDILVETYRWSDTGIHNIKIVQLL